MLTRRSILIASLVAGTFPASPALSETAPTFDAKAFADAQKAGRPILISIHASWCPTCKAQAPILSELRANPKFKDLAHFVIDFDSQKDLVNRFGPACNRPSSRSRAKKKRAARSAIPSGISSTLLLVNCSKSARRCWEGRLAVNNPAARHGASGCAWGQACIAFRRTT